MNVGKTFFFLTNLFLLSASERSFLIDYQNNQFLRDNQPFRYISGEIHYSRVPHQYWEDRLMKIKAAGLNAIQTIIPWNFHEAEPGQYLWDEDRDIDKFLDLAAKYDLMVLLRPGPYICAEWENGGLPYWLLRKYPNITMRSSDSDFLDEVDRWWTVLYAKIKRHLYANGGSIIMVQMENEYGFHGCDRKYRNWLRDKTWSLLGNSTILYTVDGAGENYLKCGSIEGTYTTVDFGVSTYDTVKSNFDWQRKYAPKGPQIDTELWTAWFDHWGEPWQTLPSLNITLTMKYIANFNASWNFYMFHGGTNFGYWAADNLVTSYDYDAPLSEAGDPTEKYYAIRQKISDITGNSLLPVPSATKKIAYGSVSMKAMVPVVDFLDLIARTPIKSTFPLTQEEIYQAMGFTLYQTRLSKNGQNLAIKGIQDRGHVMLDGDLAGIVTRYEKKLTLSNINAKQGQLLEILVENMGRLNDGYNHPKGIIENVTLDGQILTEWTIYPLDFEKAFKYMHSEPMHLKVKREVAVSNSYVPSLYFGIFVATEIADTFFDPSGWTKGQVLINGYNVGRYWPTKGPQVTLYVPKFYLKPINHVIVLELDGPGKCDDEQLQCAVSFTDEPLLNKKP